MSQKSTNPPSTYNTFTPERNGKYSIAIVKFNGNFLKQDSVSFIHGNVANLYISYKLDAWSRDFNTTF